MTAKTTWRPAPYKPPMLSNGRVQLGVAPVLVPLGWRLLMNVGLPLVIGAGAIYATGAIAKSAVPDIPINKRSVGRAALLGGGGIAAYYASDLLPQSWKPVAYIAAVAGVAGAMYVLFSEPGPETAENVLPNRTAKDYMPNIDPGSMLKALTLFVDPDQPDTGGYRRWPWGDQEFEIIVKNEMSRPVTLFVGVVVSAEGAKAIYKSPIIDPKYGRKRVDLAPGQDKKVRLVVPSSAVGILKDYGVSFEIFRQGEDPAAFRESSSIPITYTYLPFG